MSNNSDKPYYKTEDPKYYKKGVPTRVNFAEDVINRQKASQQVLSEEFVAELKDAITATVMLDSEKTNVDHEIAVFNDKDASHIEISKLPQETIKKIMDRVKKDHPGVECKVGNARDTLNRITRKLKEGHPGVESRIGYDGEDIIIVFATAKEALKRVNLILHPDVKPLDKSLIQQSPAR